MLPTTLTSTKKEMLQTLEIYEDASRNNISGAQILGMRLKGQYFAMNQRGTQDSRYIREPDPEEYKDILSHSSSVKRWSIAPELKAQLKWQGIYD